MASEAGLHIEEALERAGSWGRYQKLILLLSFVSTIPNSFPGLHFVFSLFEPHHHCKYPEEYLAYSSQSVKNPDIISTITPFEPNQENKWVQSKCKMYDRNFSQYPVERWPEHFKDANDSDIIDCNNGTTYSLPKNEASATMEFSLICENDWKAPLAVSLYFVGMGIGCVFETTADWRGRKPAYIVSSVLQMMFQSLTAISWNFPIFCLSVFGAGVTDVMTYGIMFVLATEITDHKWRNFLSLSCSFGYTFGYCSVSLFAFFFRPWRYFIGAMTITGAILRIPCCWFFPESPRWLAEKGRSEDAIRCLRLIAKVNNRGKVLEEALETKEGHCIFAKNNATSSGLVEALRVLFRSGIATRIFAVIYGWLITSVVYFAFSYYSKDFSQNRFVNFFLSGICEIPACIIGFLLLQYIGRPRTTLLLMSITGFSSIILPFIPKDLRSLSTTFAILGKGAVAAVFFAWFLLSTEIVPTLQRSSTLSICSAAARVGAFCCPYLMYFRKYNNWIPNVALGVVSLSSGLLAIMFVPETLGVRLPDTVDEARTNKRIYGINILKKFPNTKEDVEKQIIGDDVDVKTSMV